MFKKTLTAVALAAAFCSASAGEVTLYGRMDLGLSYLKPFRFIGLT